MSGADSRDDYRRWICDACGFIYDEAKGDPDSGLAPGTRFADIPDDWQCPLCGMRKSDLRLLPEQPVAAKAAPRPERNKTTCRGGDDYVVIVGAGIAGWSVAEALRAADPECPVLLVTSCPGASYPKPALSTALARGQSADDLVQQDGAEKAAELGIELRTGTRVIKADAKARRLVTSKGVIRYGKLVLALGASQRDLPVHGDAAGDLLKVNDLSSYRRLRRQLDAGARRVTILGAGLIGCEFAEDLCAAGVAVDVIDPADRPLASLLPADMSLALQRRLAEKGVAWHLGQTLDSLDHSAGRQRAILSSGEAFDTDLVISAAGLVPHTALAERMGLKTEGGIWTDTRMRTSDPHVYAVGDCAAVEGRVYSYIEPIQRQARTIAGDITEVGQPFQVLPPLVQIKTPSLPLAVCPPAGPRAAVQAVASDGKDGCRVDYLQDGQLVGFALSGSCARQGGELYRAISR